METYLRDKTYEICATKANKKLIIFVFSGVAKINKLIK
jgi:hypothetical protein